MKVKTKIILSVLGTLAIVGIIASQSFVQYYNYSVSPKLSNTFNLGDPNHVWKNGYFKWFTATYITFLANSYTMNHLQDTTQYVADSIYGKYLHFKRCWNDTVLGDSAHFRVIWADVYKNIPGSGYTRPDTFVFFPLKTLNVISSGGKDTFYSRVHFDTVNANVIITMRPTLTGFMSICHDRWLSDSSITTYNGSAGQQVVKVSIYGLKKP